MDARDSIESQAMTDTNPDPQASPQTGAIAGPTISVAAQAGTSAKQARAGGDIELQRTIVDLPQPDGPMIAVTLSAAKCRSTPRTAWVEP